MDGRRIVRNFLQWVLLPSVIAFGLAYEARTFVSAKAQGGTIVFLREGSSVREMAKTLAANGVLESPWKFRLLAKIMRKERVLRPGEYSLDAPSSPLDLIRILTAGKVLLHRVTFPEGINLREVSANLSAAELATINDFYQFSTDPTVPPKFSLPGSTLEGFIFPDTYQFSKTDGLFKIAETCVARFRAALKPEDQARAKALGLSLLQWITLASIIEKESSKPEEHRIISSVFHNRLKKRMRLQTDPTVIYGIANFNGNLTKLDLQTPTPYNTYTNYGLPPGPIANPGASAIHAAVDPATTNYLYFVANRNGSHVFAETYEEHSKNVAVYQLGRRIATQTAPSPKKSGKQQ